MKARVSVPKPMSAFAFPRPKAAWRLTAHFRPYRAHQRVRWTSSGELIW